MDGIGALGCVTVTRRSAKSAARRGELSGDGGGLSGGKSGQEICFGSILSQDSGSCCRFDNTRPPAVTQLHRVFSTSANRCTTTTTITTTNNNNHNTNNKWRARPNSNMLGTGGESAGADGLQGAHTDPLGWV